MGSPDTRCTGGHLCAFPDLITGKHKHFMHGTIILGEFEAACLSAWEPRTDPAPASIRIGPHGAGCRHRDLPRFAPHGVEVCVAVGLPNVVAVLAGSWPCVGKARRPRMLIPLRGHCLASCGPLLVVSVCPRRGRSVSRALVGGQSTRSKAPPRPTWSPQRANGMGPPFHSLSC